MRIGKAKLVATALAMACICTTGASAFLFTWNGDGADDDWDTTGNWAAVGCTTECYPGGDGRTTDDATLPTPGDDPWTVTLITEGIDELTISDDTDFDGDAIAPPTLTAETVTINGPAIVTIDSATITAS